LACFLAAWWLMRYLGQTGSVQFAATVNILVAGGALIHEAQRRESNSDFTQPVLNDSSVADTRLPHVLALGCVAFSGFAALSYEIIWYRVLAFGLSDTATAFASLLGSYLFGLALGSRFVERYSRNHDRISAMRRLSGVIFASAVFAFAVGPLSALAFSFTSPNPENRGPGLIILLLVCSGASFFGAIFPLVAHVSVDPRGPVGASLSYLYGANIVGSTLGTLVVGYVLLDYWSVYKISIALLIGGSIFSLSVLLVAARPFNLQPRIALAAAVMFLMIVVARPIFSTLYDRLLFKNHYPRLHFQEVVETRSGTIAVTPEGTLFGSGVYDGRFNIDLFHDVNIIVRPFALSALHPAPRQVLMIGLGSGSWAQVLANHPQVESLTVVEINPGYLKLISEYPAVRTLLQNPKVHVVIDDGRRWLLSNRSVKFDAIVMNTTFYWRNHTSTLLSIEFLETARSHLQPGGVLFYNTTGSEDAIATGLAVYPYAFRLVNALAVSDSPLVFDRVRWKTILLSYVIDGKPVIDVNDPKQLEKVDKITAIPEDPTGRTLISVESNDQLRSRLRKRLIITDDNMGLEWR
jgi:spermidine synthase